MGKQVHINKIRELFKKSPVVDFKSIERIIKNKSKPKSKSNYAKLLVSNLMKKGEIKKIGKGYYTIHDELTLAVFSYHPAYLGLQSALSKHGFWEQETIPVIITAKKVRRGVKNFMGKNVLIKNLDKKYFFGFEFFKEGNFYIPYSNVEKTFIDMVVFNQIIDEEVLDKIRLRANKRKLIRYLGVYSSKTKKRVLRKFEEL